MSDKVLPCYEATVSEEIVHLLRGTQAPKLAEDAPAPSAEPEEVPPPKRPKLRAPWRNIALRRDGRRPSRFRGMLLWTETARRAGADHKECDPGGRSLRVYTTDDGRVVAQLSFEPSEDLAARPVYRTAWLEDLDDLARFLTETGPEACFAVDPFNATPEGREAFISDFRMPSKIPGLATSANHSG